MLYYTKDVARKIKEIARLVERNKLDPAEGARRILALEPDFPAAILMTGELLKKADDLNRAEEFLWNGLSRCPCYPPLYYSLAGVIARLRPGDPAMGWLLVIAFQKLSLSAEISPLCAQLMAPAVENTGPATDPQTYADQAELVAGLLEGREEHIDERLGQYRVLNDLQIESDLDLDPETLHEVLEQPATYAPLLYGAIREWANMDRETSTLPPAVLRIFIAILGEIGGPERISDLLELSQIGDEPTFFHVHWAIYRLGQRFPSAALATFRAAAKGAHGGMLCALAEQLNLLPEVEGLLPALRSLLEEFHRIARDHNAPYLLAVVADAMAERGAVDEAQSVLTRNQALLTREGREWLKESIDGDSEFVPRLVEEDIPNFSIQEVCLERVYMDDEKDDEDEDFDDEDELEDEGEFEDEGECEDEGEFEPEVPFSPRVGRNDPCWCGSGKKYKKCHLRADEEAHLTGARPAASSEEPLPLRMLKGLARWHKEADRTRAQEMFFGTAEDKARDETEFDAFVQFLLHDFRDAETRRTLIEHFLDEHGPRLSPKDRAVAESMRDSRFGLYEIFKVEKGRGIHVRDVFDGATFFVEDITSSRECVKDDCALLRVELRDGRYMLSGNGTAVARELLGEMKEFVSAESKAAGKSPAEFARANSALLRRHYLELHARRFENLRVVNSEGDELEFWTAEYEVLDRPALILALRSLAELVEEPSKDSAAHFGWMEPGEGPRSVHGSIEVTETRLRLETTSLKYRELGRGMLEYNAPRLLKHLGDRLTSVDDLKRSALSGARGPTPLPSEEERAAIQQYKAQHYSTWPNIALPALKGQTPRQAMRTNAGREALRNLLRDMEHQEARSARSGEVPYDFNILRRDLGLKDD